MNDHFWVRLKSSAGADGRFNYGLMPDIIFEARKEYVSGAVGDCQSPCCYKTSVNLPDGWIYIPDSYLQRLSPIEMLAKAAE